MEKQSESIQTAIQHLKDNLVNLPVQLIRIDDNPYNNREDLGNRFCKNNQGEIDNISLYWMSIHWYSGSYYFLSPLQYGNLFEYPDLQGVPHLQHNLQGQCYRVGRWWVAEQNRLGAVHNWDPDIMFNLRFSCEKSNIVTKSSIRLT